MPNRFKTDEFFLSNICLTSADKKTSTEELINPQMSNRIKTDDSVLSNISLTSADKKTSTEE